ncbi:MAG: type II secretion system F family protein [Aquificaceae bacterium]|nr:type II secretion system F family protein [Aquificaceae bacterium]
MPKFKYKAFNESGTFVESEGSYPNEEALLTDLQVKGLNVVEVKKLEEEGEQEQKKSFTLSFLSGKKVSDRDLSIFCRQLGTMINAGLNLVDALEIIGEQIPNKNLSEASKKVANMVREGRPISNSMADFPAVFPEFVVNLVRVGEETGNLDIALTRAADYYEKMAMIKSKIKSAAFYPIFVLVVSVIIVGGIIYFLVPTFADIYSSFGGQLPLPTQMLVSASNALRANLINIIITIAVSVFIFRFLMSTNYQFKKSVHAFMLRAPKMGELVTKSTMARFARTMATLFSSGVALERAFEIAGQVSGNVIIKEALENAKKSVMEGEPMHRSLERTGMFPKLTIAMVRVGEDTGRLDEMLDTVARFYEDEFDKAVEGMIKLIEPMLMVFLGGVVSAILIALYLPIFKIGELIR